MKQIKLNIENFLEKYSNIKKIGIYAESVFENQENQFINYNSNQNFVLASTVKIITAIAFYKKLKLENIKDNFQIDYKKKLKIPGSGILQYMENIKISYYNLLVLALTISDNTASQILFDFVGLKEHNLLIKQFNLKNTKICENIKELVNLEISEDSKLSYKDYLLKEKQTNAIREEKFVFRKNKNISTPKEFCEILKELINPKIIDKKSSNKILDLMNKCLDFNILKKYEFDSKIMHKGGWLFSGSNAIVGLVENKNKFFVFAIMIKFKNPTKSFVENFSNKEIFEEISNNVIENFYQKIY